MKLKHILKGIEARIDPRMAEMEIKFITANSKEAGNGCLFVAIEGFQHDGHIFVKEAFKKGAAVCIVRKGKNGFSNMDVIRVNDTREALIKAANNYFDSPCGKLKLVGVTGTNGKTTTSLLLESVFNRAGISCGLLGTIEYRIGKRRLTAQRTTPDVLTLNAYFHEMIQHGMKAAVMEVSSQALDQKRVGNIFFDLAIFTNLTHEHLDYHSNMRRYFESKLKIFENLKRNGSVILNMDDKYSKLCMKYIIDRNIITYGVNNAADIGVKIKNLDSDGSEFDVYYNKKNIFDINTKLIGLHNISNILAAVSAAIKADISFKDIKKGIETLEIVPGRLETVEGGQDFKVFVDYAHTHNALLNILSFLSEIKKRNIITVFGCGGDRDRLKRPLMAKVAQDYSDFFIITDDNPRSENPKDILSDILRGIDKQRSNYDIIHDRKKAIEKALRMASKDDIVLIAGKGHETVQIIGKTELPFDDRKAAEEVLSNIKPRLDVVTLK